MLRWNAGLAVVILVSGAPLSLATETPPGHDFRLPISGGREVIRSGRDGPGVRNLFWQRNGPDWVVFWDEKLETPRFLSPRTRLVISRPDAIDEEVLASTRQFVEANRRFFGVSGNELIEGVVKRLHQHRLVIFRQGVSGVPVRGASLRVLLDREGAIASVDSFLLRAQAVPPADYPDPNEFLNRARLSCTGKLGALERQVVFPSPDPTSARHGWCIEATYDDLRASELFFSAEGTLLGESDLAQGFNTGKVYVSGDSPDPEDIYATVDTLTSLFSIPAVRVFVSSGARGVTGDFADLGLFDFESPTDRETAWSHLAMGTAEELDHTCTDPEASEGDRIKTIFRVLRRKNIASQTDFEVDVRTLSPQPVDEVTAIPLTYNQQGRASEGFELLVYHNVQRLYAEAWLRLGRLWLPSFPHNMFPLKVVVISDTAFMGDPKYDGVDCGSYMQIPLRKDEQSPVSATKVQHEFAHHLIVCMTGSNQKDELVEGVADSITVYMNMNPRIWYLAEDFPGTQGYSLTKKDKTGDRGLVGRSLWRLLDSTRDQPFGIIDSIRSLLYHWLSQRQVATRDQIAFDSSRVLLEQFLVADDSLPGGNGDGNLRNGTPRDKYIIPAFREEQWDVFSTRFVRGDVDRSGTIDLTDPVAVLLYLFLGGDEDRCRDAMDIDDNHEVNVTDPVRLLNYLFLGMEPPAVPFPGCGPDPTNDGDNLWCSESSDACRQ